MSGIKTQAVLLSRKSALAVMHRTDFRGDLTKSKETH